MKNYTIEELKGLQEKGIAWILNNELYTDIEYKSIMKETYDDNHPDCTFEVWCDSDDDVISIETKINKLEEQA